MSRDRTRPATVRLLPEALFCLLVVIVFADPLFTRRNFTGRDLLPYHLPVEREMHDAYARGTLPVWTQHISGGRPLLPNPNLGALYPFRPLLAPLPFPAAFRIYPILHWILAGLGMLRLSRAIGMSPAAGWIAAVSYTFSGVGIGEVFYTNIQPGMALLPWALWAAARPAATLASRVLPAAVVLAIDMYAGDVFTIGIAIAAWALWLLLETEPPARRREAAMLAAAAGLAVLLAAPQIVSSALWAPLTQRAVLGIPVKVATTFSLSPWRLLEIVVPYPFGATWSLEAPEIWGRTAFRNFFATIFCGGLAALALPLLVRRGPREKASRFVAASIGAAVVACVLPGLLPASWGDWRSPIPLRYPEKFSVGLVFGLALAAALATDKLRSGTRPPRGRIAIAMALAAVAVAARLAPGAVGAVAASAVGARPSADAGRQIAVAFAEAGLLWAATLVAIELLPIRRRFALPAALGLLAAVPVLANARIGRTEPEESIFRPPAFARFVARHDPGHAFRTLDESRYRAPSGLDAASQAREGVGVGFYRASWFLYTPCLWDRGTVFNSDPDVGDFSRMESLRKVSAVFPNVPNGNALFSSGSLRWGIRFRDQAALPGFLEAGGDAFQSWDENPAALPSIRVPARFLEAPGSVDALRSFPRLGAGEIVLENGRASSGVSPAAAVEAIEERPERLRFSVTSAAPAWVFVLRGFWPYRTVTVDGEPAEVVPAQLAFSAVAVPAGRHRVEWRERVPGGELSVFGPVLFLIGALVILRREGRAHGEAA